MSIIPISIILLSAIFVFVGLVLFGRWVVGDEKPRKFTKDERPDNG